MRKIFTVVVGLIIVVVLVLLSPIIFFGTMGVIGRIEYSIQKSKEDKATEAAKSLIEPFKIDGEEYDIGIIIFGISNSNIEYSNTGEGFVIDSVEYEMGSSAFNNKSTYWLYSYNEDGNDVQLINDICRVLNNYDLDYEYVDTYIYRGSGYGDSYVFGGYDTAYLNGQYLEITLRPVDWQSIVLRFDLELLADSLEHQIIMDLRGIENVDESEIPWSIANLLDLITVK